MDKQIFQIPATIISDKSMANGCRRFVVETQEMIEAEKMQQLISMENKLGWFNFAVRIIEPKDLLDLPELEKTFDTKKSPAQRLRGVLYRLWEKTGNKEVFDIYYVRMMEKIINQFKDKLE